MMSLRNIDALDPHPRSAVSSSSHLALGDDVRLTKKLDLSPSNRSATTSVTKALQLLDSFHLGETSLGVTELARRTELPKSTAFRLLANLEQSGYLERDGTNYRVGWRLFELGNRVQHCTPQGLREVALPSMSEMFASTRQVVNLAILEGHDVVFLEKIYGRQAVRTPSSVGSRMPATCVALGKAMLAFGDPPLIRRVAAGGLKRRTRYSIAEPGRLLRELAGVRSSGVAYDREETALGLVCVAAPILVDGRAIAAFSVSGASIHFNAKGAAVRVREAAAAIAAEYLARHRSHE